MKVEGATAVYAGTWWVVEVPGYGATQCRRVDETRRLARALVADLEGIEVDEVEVDLDVHGTAPA